MNKTLGEQQLEADVVEAAVRLRRHINSMKIKDTPSSESIKAYNDYSVAVEKLIDYRDNGTTTSN